MLISNANSTTGYNMAIAFCDAVYNRKFDELKPLLTNSVVLLYTSDDNFTKLAGIEAVFQFFQKNYSDLNVTILDQQLSIKLASANIQLSGKGFSGNDRIGYQAQITLNIIQSDQEKLIDAITIDESIS